MAKFYYGAYSHDLLNEEFRNNFKYIKYLDKTTLPGYRLVYRGNETDSFLTIEESINNSVELVIYELKEKEIKSLNDYMYYPNIYSITYKVAYVLNEPKTIMLYYVQDRFDYRLPNKNKEKLYDKWYEYYKIPSKVLEKAYIDTYESISLKRVK